MKNEQVISITDETVTTVQIINHKEVKMMYENNLSFDEVKNIERMLNNSIPCQIPEKLGNTFFFSVANLGNFEKEHQHPKDNI